MSKFAETMRWLAKDVEVVPGKRDRILNPCTFITGTTHFLSYASRSCVFCCSEQINSQDVRACVILCGAINTARMLRQDIEANLGFKPSGFTPTFESKLSNLFLTYTNYTSDRFGQSAEDFGDLDGDEK